MISGIDTLLLSISCEMASMRMKLSAPDPMLTYHQWGPVTFIQG